MPSERICQSLITVNMPDEEKKPASVGRRQFLRSVFGLGTLAETQQEEAEAAGPQPGRFFWTDLKTGQIGFPSGHFIPSGMPGSLMKLVTTAALTDAKIITPEEKFECRGIFKLHNEIYKCQIAHGIVDLPHALGMSCNVYFAHISQKLSARTVLEYASRFGLDRAVEQFACPIFPSERLGSNSEKYVLGLAEDLQPGAMQILRMSALIANEGNLPYMHSAERPDKNGKSFHMDLSPLSWQVLKQGMQIAGREGTAKKLDPENKLKIAVKTGTTPHGKSFQSWICGFFPWDAPRYAFVLRSPSGTSQDEAVPQAHKFLFSVEWP